MADFCLPTPTGTAITGTVTDELIPTRATLLQRLKDWQDQAGWQDFFDTYWSLIFGFAIQSGLSQSEAEDVVQETLISVAKHMPAFQYDPAIGSFKGWLLNQTRWRIADQIRRRRRRGLYEQGVEEDFPPPENLDVQDTVLDKIWDEEWEKNIFQAATIRAKRKVEARQWQIFDFYAVKGWSPEETAKAFEVPVGQVYLIKHRISEIIRLEVEQLKKETN